MRYRRSRGKRDSLGRLVTWTRPRCWRILLILNLWSWGHHRLLRWHVRVWWGWLWYWWYTGGRLRGGWSRKRPCSRHWHCSGWHTLLALRFCLLSGSNHSACSIVIQGMLLYFAILLHVHHLYIKHHPNLSTLPYAVWETIYYSLPRHNTARNMFPLNSSRTLLSCCLVCLQLHKNMQLFLDYSSRWRQRSSKMLVPIDQTIWHHPLQDRYFPAILTRSPLTQQFCYSI